jgi:hypothetical protein
LAPTVSNRNRIFWVGDYTRKGEHGAGTIKGVARKFGVHRRMVREAIGNAVPAARKIPGEWEGQVRYLPLW